MPGQHEPERHLNTGMSGGDVQLTKPVRPHLQPTRQAREAAQLDGVWLQGRRHRGAGLGQPLHLRSQDSQVGFSGGDDVWEGPRRLQIRSGPNDAGRVALRADGFLR